MCCNVSEPKDGVFDKFLEELKDLGAGKKFPFTLNIRDPLGNSFISAHLGKCKYKYNTSIDIRRNSNMISL